MNENLRKKIAARYGTKVSVTNLWETPQPETETVKEVKEITETVDNSHENLDLTGENKIEVKDVAKEENLVITKNTKFVIKAMKSRVGTQMYLSSWDDFPEEWCISAVPYPASKERCYALIEKANKQLENASRAVIKDLRKDITFEITPIKEEELDSYEQIAARANKMLKEARANRKDK